MIMGSMLLLQLQTGTVLKVEVLVWSGTGHCDRREEKSYDGDGENGV
jgi:hypothetical protein